MYITEQNKHIEDYLNYYCRLLHPPKSAILLKGEWGSGKTWFIKKYCKQLNEIREKSIWKEPISNVLPLIKDKISHNKNIPKRCIYISLYGLEKLSDIDEAIYKQIHPFWSSEQVKIAGHIIKSLIKYSTKLDLGDNNQNSTTFNIQVPDIPNNLEYINFKEVNKRVLIFDDLERCNINHIDLLGYINNFIEHQNLKVIIVAEETKLESKENYLIFKEKLIGKTFEVLPDFQGAINDFRNQIQNQTVEKIISDKANYIFTLFEAGKFNNLRVLH